MKTINILIGVGAFVSAQLAHAQIIVNGGFETGLTGWTATGSNILINGGIPPDGGVNSVELGTVGSLGYLSQTFSTRVNDIYQVSFEFQGLNNASQEFDVLFGAPAVLPTLAGLSTYFGFTDLFTLGGPNASTPEFFNLPANVVNTWQTYTFDVVATGSTSELLFATRQDPGFDRLDNVSMVDLSGVTPVLSAVPEPSTYGLAGAALLGVIALYRRKRN